MVQLAKEVHLIEDRWDWLLADYLSFAHFFHGIGKLAFLCLNFPDLPKSSLPHSKEQIKAGFAYPLRQLLVHSDWGFPVYKVEVVANNVVVFDFSLSFGDLVRRFGDLVRRFGDLVRRFGDLVRRFGDLVMRFGDLVRRLKPMLVPIGLRLYLKRQVVTALHKFYTENFGFWTSLAVNRSVSSGVPKLAPRRWRVLEGISLKDSLPCWVFLLILSWNRSLIAIESGL